MSMVLVLLANLAPLPVDGGDGVRSKRVRGFGKNYLFWFLSDCRWFKVIVGVIG